MAQILDFTYKDVNIGCREHVQGTKGDYLKGIKGNHGLN